MESWAKIKNVGKKEGALRSVIGFILIIFAFLISGFFGWVLGAIGVLIILTAVFGY